MGILAQAYYAAWYYVTYIFILNLIHIIIMIEEQSDSDGSMGSP